LEATGFFRVEKYKGRWWFVDPDGRLCFHALNRGNNRQDVFLDDDDRRAFLDAVAKAKDRYPFALLGYCLMSNHFHILVRVVTGRSASLTNEDLLEKLRNEAKVV